MRRVLASLLATTIAATMSFSVSGFAADNPVDITDISIDQGLISVNTKNNGDTSKLTLTVNKQDTGLTSKEKLFAVLQEEVETGASVTYKFLIPDVNEFGVSGTGTYQVRVTNTQKEGDSQEFKYANSTTVMAFIDALKLADALVSSDSQAWDALDDVIKDSAYEGVYFTIGMDYDLYASKSETVQRDTLNVFHKDGIQSLTKDTLPSAFLSAFGVAAFNNGEKQEGVTILSPKYNGAAPDDGLKDNAIALMNSSYESGSAFASGFTKAYGLATINGANINNMDVKLKDFKQATGLCTEQIDKVLNLNDSYRFKAFEYMLTYINTTPVQNETALANLLDAAYTAALNGGGTGAGGGGFGGGTGGGGSFGNSTAPSQGSVSSPVGSGSFDQKYQPTTVGGFTDLMSDHWAAESILYLKNHGIVSGTDTGAFEPDRTVTREEFTKMVVLAFDFTLADKGVDFTDAESGAWYLPYIATAVENGIINGMGDNRFGIGMEISRQDMAVIVERAMNAKGISLSAKKTYSGFADETEIADYAKEPVKALFESGVINGKDNNRFDPAGNATRAEAAKIIYEACKGGK